MRNFSWTTSNYIRRLITFILIYSQFLQLAFAAVLPNLGAPPSANRPGYQSSLQNNTLDNALHNLSLTSKQLGLSGPLSAGATYSDLTGTYFNAQYILPLGDSFAFGALGEYGSKQYRLNGTLGYAISPLSQMKFSAERLGQRLPFDFSSGVIDAQVHQDAYGLRFQQYFDLPFLQGINAGGYYATAANKYLDPVVFTSSSENCGGYGSGLTCINYRYIAGAGSAGLDFGMDFLLTSTTLVKGNLYYDQVRYHTLFNPFSDHDRDGVGAGVKIEQLLGSRFKLSGEATAREIYDTYQGGVSWLPGFSRLGMELSVVGQHISSRNATPDNSNVNVQLNFLFDANKNYNEHFRWGSQHLSDIAQWVQAPAVHMNQVLAIAEELTVLLAPTITAITPDSGPFAGGNLVTITGSNFIQGLLVFFNGQLASSIQVLSPTTIQVIVPPFVIASSLLMPSDEVVDVVVENADGQAATFISGYRYTGSPALPPVVSAISPSSGGTNGGTAVTITGQHFQGATSVTIGGVALTNLTVNAAGTIITGLTGAHTLANNLPLLVATPVGVSSGGPTYSYLLNPPAITSPIDGALINDATPGFVGTGEPGAAITVKTGATTLCSAIADSSGNWSCISGVSLANGPYAVDVTQTDSFSNVSAPTTINITINASVVPPPPVISSPTNNSYVNAVMAALGVTVSGTGEAGDIIHLSLNGSPVVTTIVAADNSWSILLAPSIWSGLSDGNIALSATQSNGTDTSTPTSINVILDRAPPPLTLNSVGTNNVINLAQTAVPLVVSGASEPGLVVQVVFNGNTYITAVDGTGNWSLSIPVSDLAGLSSGTSVMRASVTDAAGNNTSTQQDVTVDVTIPILSVDPIAGDNYINISEASAGFAITGTTSPVNNTVTVTYLGTSYPATVSSAGNWVVTIPGVATPMDLPQGPTTVNVTAASTPGQNMTTTSTTLIIVTVAPTISVNEPASLSKLNGGNVTGSAAFGYGSVAGSVVIVTIGSTVVASGTVLANGTWSIHFTSTQLSSFTAGTSPSLNATIVDAAGNLAAINTTVAITLT